MSLDSSLLVMGYMLCMHGDITSYTSHLLIRKFILHFIKNGPCKVVYTVNKVAYRKYHFTTSVVYETNCQYMENNAHLLPQKQG